MTTILPDFLVIGAARCGSTWIHEALKEHPAIAMPLDRKEIHFFNRDSHYAQGLGWYAPFFTHKTDDQICGEVTPSYLSDEKAAARIAQHVPKAKLVVSLRNPAERAFSSYTGYVMAGKLSPSDTIFEADKKLDFDNQSSLLAHGHYAEHLARYFSLFPRENILVLFYEDLAKDPQNFISRIYTFLEVDATYQPAVLNKRVNEGRFSSFLRFFNVVASWLPESVQKYIQKTVIMLRKKLAPRHKEIPSDLKTQLDDYYRGYNRKLAELLGVELPENWAR